jgi:putative NIF3 family GTP cyclohydrolase 1 type 2
MALSEVADVLADGLPSPHLRVAGDLDRVVEVVAACGGAGDSLIGAALSAGAHVYVTGDLRHHVTLDAMTMGMAAIDAGHYATEAPALATLVVALRGAAARRGLEARLLPSQIRTEPWAAWWPQNRGQA